MHYKSGLIGLTGTLDNIFKQRNCTPGSSNENPPAKTLRTKNSTDTRTDATCVGRPCISAVSQMNQISDLAMD